VNNVVSPDEPDSRLRFLSQAVAIQWLTIGWMIIEAITSLFSGIAAHSTSLVAFGADSFIELISASIVLWRLLVEVRHGREFSASAERQASRFGGLLLFALAGYVIVSAAWSIWTHGGEQFSLPGLVIITLAVPVMYMLARRKLTLAKLLQSRALRSDAVESIACGWLSLVVLAGLLAQLLIGAWWIDAATSLAILWFLVKEGRESWRGECCC
jgi:divalent metal cation (Fe/Co/Zn/Cd) transporter